MRQLCHALTLLLLPLFATLHLQAQPRSAQGSVIEFQADQGELIVFRDGIIYYLMEGDDLFVNDILRAKDENTTTITFRGCTFELPASEDVILDDEFCVVAVDQPTLAELESLGHSSDGLVSTPSTNRAPLIVGGVVLSVGGLSAAVGQRGGSSASDPVVASSRAGENGANASSP